VLEGTRCHLVCPAVAQSVVAQVQRGQAVVAEQRAGVERVIDQVAAQHQRKQRAVAARPKRLPLRSARALEKRRLRMCTRAAELVQAQRRLMARAAAHGLRLQAHLYSVVGVCYSVVRVTHLEGVCCSAVGVPLTACASF
jgi:hypothetical protein